MPDCVGLRIYRQRCTILEKNLIKISTASRRRVSYQEELRILKFRTGKFMM